MPEHPLLVFPAPARADRAKRQGFGGKVRLPNAQGQAGRLAPQFQRLQQVMGRQRLVLQGNSLGIQPEQVLVLETVGPIQDFVKAVKKVEGLEWLAEFELDDIEPEYGFENEEDAEKPLKGQLFLVMTDQRALQEMQNLFSNWQQDSDMIFPRGLTPLKHAFEHLHTIRPWDAQDRIRETGIFEDWQFRVEHGQQNVPFEAELWFRSNPARRRQAELYLANLVEILGGEITQQCTIPEISYHAILGHIPAGKVPDIVSQQEVQLLQCEDIMHLRPLGQCAVRVADDLAETETLADADTPGLPTGEPVIALFDGLPLTGHRLLDDRLIIDDPDGYETAYQAGERLHGTTMASLICHGDLDENGSPAARPLYVRPIMQPQRSSAGSSFESIPDGVLPVDLIHRAVRRLFESEGSEPPAAPSVRVINLSVCDRSRPFDRGMSSWARLLDWLSWKYGVLFVVSAGNHAQDIELDVPRPDLRQLSPVDREKAVIKAIVADTRHRRLLSPAETLNGITLGASHADASVPLPSTGLIEPFARPGLPSTISAQGPGYRRTIKPDIFLPGGRQFLAEKQGTTHSKAVLQTSFFTRPPGQRVATPGRTGELDRTMYTRGTSNSAALASRWLGTLFDVIERLRAEPDVSLPHEYETVLLKTLLIHGADWSGAGDLYEAILKNAQNSRTFTDYAGRFLGYGVPNVPKVMVCTDQRVTVLGFGRLDDGEGQEFHLPLPPSLSAVTEKRRLTVTLAWLTPVNSQRQNYRIAHLWFSPKNDLATDRICADHHAVQRGTVQHEVLESAKAVDFQDGDTIVIKVNCRSDAGDLPEPIRYGLAVTLEVAEGISIPIYEEVRDRLRIRIPVPGGRTT
ncbi:MAG TPA: S8 family peptidase [Candidatus Hydrogenedentes bacterium]|nr:S8 family peptidase [Candidatus Hydrogenedentota bacterium]HPG66454.1 S8 family peptidase [Candidatus Hydrogenedentota bacterium]